MRKSSLFLCLSLGLSLGICLLSPRAVTAGPPVLFVPPPAQIPTTEPVPAGQKPPSGLMASAPGAPIPASAGAGQKPATPAKVRRLRVTIAPVPSPGVDDKALVAVQREFGDALKRNTHLDMKDLDVRLADFAQEVPSDQVDFARESLQKGKDLLYKLEVDQAIAQLADAVDQLVAVLPYIKKQELADAMITLAVAQMQKGKNTAMNQTLRRLLIWRPAFQPDSDVPPQINDPLETARQTVSQLPQAQIRINSDPPGAQVFVDGDYIGVSPTVASNLAVGEHYVTFKKLGYKRGLRVAQVTKSGVDVTDKLQRAEKYLLVEQAIARTAPQMGKSPLDPVVDNLKETLFLDHMVFMEAKKGVTDDEIQLKAYLYDLRNRRLLSSKDGRVKLLAGGVPQSGSLVPLAEALYEKVNYSGDLEAPVDALPPPVAEAKPLYKRWWFWTALGVVVAGGATAIAVGLATRPPTCPSGHVCTGSVTYALSF
jgi:hypothetical protein